MENGLEMGSQKKPNDLLFCRKEGTLEANRRDDDRHWRGVDVKNEDEKINNYVLNYASTFCQHSLQKKM